MDAPLWVHQSGPRSCALAFAPRHWCTNAGFSSSSAFSSKAWVVFARSTRFASTCCSSSGSRYSRWGVMLRTARAVREEIRGGELGHERGHGRETTFRDREGRDQICVTGGQFVGDPEDGLVLRDQPRRAARCGSSRRCCKPRTIAPPVWTLRPCRYTTSPARSGLNHRRPASRAGGLARETPEIRVRSSS